MREQYTHILKVINQSGTVETPEEGFRKVEESTTGQFAFIYDAAEIKYQFYKNCNFIEVGEPFAEQPLVLHTVSSHTVLKRSKMSNKIHFEGICRSIEYLNFRAKNSNQDFP